MEPKGIFLMAVIFITFFCVLIDSQFRLFSRPIRSKYFYNVKFISQVGWSEELTELGCEEAAILMARDFKGQPSKNPKLEMDKLITYQVNNYGGHNQIGPKNIAEILKKINNIDSKTVEVKSASELKGYMAEEQIVIVPAIAKHLRNHLYKEKGYHMIVLIGFDNNGFFAHDPGTGSGNQFYYSDQRIINSISNIENGKKEVLLVRR